MQQLVLRYLNRAAVVSAKAVRDCVVRGTMKGGILWHACRPILKSTSSEARQKLTEWALLRVARALDGAVVLVVSAQSFD